MLLPGNAVRSPACRRTSLEYNSTPSGKTLPCLVRRKSCFIVQPPARLRRLEEGDGKGASNHGLGARFRRGPFFVPARYGCVAPLGLVTIVLPLRLGWIVPALLLLTACASVPDVEPLLNQPVDG